ncbi:hypothetical protein Bca4012_060558 [Brassica carinata]
MAYNAESSRFRRSRSNGGRRMCDCGLPAKISTSWDDKNLAESFWLKWAMNIASSLTGLMKGSRWVAKRALIEARDEIREKQSDQ